MSAMTPKLILGSLASLSMTSLLLASLPASAKPVLSNNSQQDRSTTLSGNLHQSNRPTASPSEIQSRATQPASAYKPAVLAPMSSTTPMQHQNAPHISQVLHLGSRGESVRTLQALLKKEGLYEGTVDGIFGRQTRTAVMAFQRIHGLRADGIVGSHTQAAINNLA